MTDVGSLLEAARTSHEGVDSSKLRGTSLRRVEQEGLVKIEKYHRTVGYLVSPAVVEALAEFASDLERVPRELAAATSLLTIALKLGISPEQAVSALVNTRGESARVDVGALTTLIEEAADDLEAAAVARQRLQSPIDLDWTLNDVAVELGFDLGVLRVESEAAAVDAHHTSS